jgi:hypothetical protein
VEDDRADALLVEELIADAVADIRVVWAGRSCRGEDERDVVFADREHGRDRFDGTCRAEQVAGHRLGRGDHRMHTKGRLAQPTGRYKGQGVDRRPPGCCRASRS